MNLKKVLLTKIKPDPNQPRKTFAKEDLDKMVATIKSEGIISPIEITPDFKILVGEMRWRAAKKAGLKEIPCIINDKPDYKKAVRRLERQLIENEARTDLNRIEQGLAWKKYLDSGKRIVDLQKLLGYKVDTSIRDTLSLIEKSRGRVIDKLAEDDTNWSLYSEVSKVSLPQKQINKIHKKIEKGELKTNQEVRATTKIVKDNPEIADEIIDAENELERNMIVIQNKRQPSVERETSKKTQKGRTKDEAEEARYRATISGITKLRLSLSIFMFPDAADVLKKYSDKKTLGDIKGNLDLIIKTLVKVQKKLG